MSELVPFEPAWRELLARSSSNEPTLTPLWLHAWWRVFGAQGGRELEVVLFFEGERLVGLAPLLRRWHWYRPGIPFRRLELLASGEPEADEISSDYIGIVAERGREQAVVDELAAMLASRRLGRWDELVLPAMDGGAPTSGLLVAALERVGIRAESEVTSTCPYIELPSTWDAYLALLPSASRYRVTRSLRDFERWAAGDAKLHEARTPAELAEGNRVLRVLHGERWRADHSDGVFVSPQFSSFHEEVMGSLLAQGALELLWLTVRGEPVAVVYNLVWNGKVYFYQSGRKLDVPKGVRPGTVLHARAIQRAIAAGRREYDFLAGASRYKLELATATRPLVRVRAVRSPLLEAVHRTLRRGLTRAPVALEERLSGA